MARRLRGQLPVWLPVRYGVEVTRSGRSWDQSVIWNFGQNGDGVMPVGGVISTKAGNLYGTTSGGGQDGSGDFCYEGIFGATTVYQLTPSGSGWTENVLHTFPSGSGDLVYSGLIFDQSGSLYGAGCNGGISGSSGGFAFKLSAFGRQLGYSGLYNFSGGPELGPVSSLFMDSAGNLYGSDNRRRSVWVRSVFKADTLPMAPGRKPCFTILPAAATEHIRGALRYLMPTAISTARRTAAA